MLFMGAFVLLSMSAVAIYTHVQHEGNVDTTPPYVVNTTTVLFESWNDFELFLNSTMPPEFSETILLPR